MMILKRSPNPEIIGALSSFKMSIQLSLMNLFMLSPSCRLPLNRFVNCKRSLEEIWIVKIIFYVNLIFIHLVVSKLLLDLSICMKTLPFLSTAFVWKRIMKSTLSVATMKRSSTRSCKWSLHKHLLTHPMTCCTFHHLVWAAQEPVLRSCMAQESTLWAS